jgi:hypothetical protein
MNEIIHEYLEYVKKVGDRSRLYKHVSQRYGITSAVNPGSHIDITPSLFIPDVTYIDNFKGTARFFRDLAPIMEYVNEHKHYVEQYSITFFESDYNQQLNISKTDLIISQYAGFVGQAAKRYLDDYGILLCNDSHGDATLAYLDRDYELIGVTDAAFTIQETGLASYFKISHAKEIDIDSVLTTMKGPRYTHQAVNYLFRLRPGQPGEPKIGKGRNMP